MTSWITTSSKKFCLVNTIQSLTDNLNNRPFKIRFLNGTTAAFPTEAGVPQGSVLGPILYFIYTTDLLTSANVNRATFVDDTAVLAANQKPRSSFSSPPGALG